MKVSRRLHALLPLILVLSTLTGSAIVEAEDGTPTLQVTIHRIQSIDPIEGPLEGEPDWIYRIEVWDGGGWQRVTTDTTVGDGDLTGDHTHAFTLDALSVNSTNVYITLFEVDTFITSWGVADISGDPGAIQQDQREPAPLTAVFKGVYNLVTGSFTGDPLIMDGGLLMTSGEFDGSTDSDENDAAIWFTVQDDYETPTAEAGLDQSSLTGEKLSFDGSASQASAGSTLVAYEWDFESDGVIDATGAKPSRVFPLMGSYTVTLRVTDSLGETSTDALTVTVLNREPTASFNHTPLEPTLFQTIQFRDNSTDPDGNVTAWAWDFGDGTASTQKDPTHKYGDRGSYTVTLTVTDNDGGTDASTRVITTRNLEPTASFRAPGTANVGDGVRFVDESTDPEGGPLTYLWNFGDGSTSTARNPIHEYDAPDAVLVTLLITDDEGATHTATLTIVIFPTIRPDADFSHEPEGGTIHDTVAFFDESWDLDGSILAWEWDFGDGETSRRKDPTHRFEDKGIHRVTLTVEDDDGNTDTVTKSVIIENLPPTAEFTASTTAAQIDDEIRFTDSSADPEDHRLRYSWDFGDGSSSDASNPSHRYDEAGTYTVALTVTDDEGETDTASASVRVEGAPAGGGGIPGFPIASLAIGALLGALILSRLGAPHRREMI
ncbi:MAG: PKD domain-containing protein [Candidatus Bathyarchaeota archaeon]|nr:PKD domain-containing protein [Candidatus Bathyarchaeota archaeon]